MSHNTHKQGINDEDSWSLRIAVCFMMTLVMTSMTNKVLLLVGTASDGADEDSGYISPNRKFTLMVPRTCDDGTSS